MTEENELARLEGFVSGLLERFNALKNDNIVLTDRLGRRDETIENLQSELAAMTNERGEISSRVNNLIGKIEDWEVNSEVSVKDGYEEQSDGDSHENSSDSGFQENHYDGDS